MRRKALKKLLIADGRWRILLSSGAGGAVAPFAVPESLFDGDTLLWLAAMASMAAFVCTLTYLLTFIIKPPE